MSDVKRDKFVKLAENRTQAALKNISLIGNLSNKNNYSYTEDDVKKIIRALLTEVKELEVRFGAGTKTEKVFKL